MKVASRSCLVAHPHTTRLNKRGVVGGSQCVWHVAEIDLELTRADFRRHRVGRKADLVAAIADFPQHVLEFTHRIEVVKL